MTEDNLSTGRQHILEQAQHLFAMRGYHGASIRDIAQASGFSNASLYYHFGNKQNLYFEVIKTYITEVAQQLLEAGAVEGSCRQRLTRMANAYAEIIVESQSAIHNLLRDLTQFGREEIRHLLPDARRRIQSTIAAVLEEGIAAGEVQQVNSYRVGVLLLGMISSLAALRIYGEVAETMAEDMDLVIGTLFEGIGA